MKIKDTEIKIIKGDIQSSQADVKVDDINGDELKALENSVREACAKALEHVQEAKNSSVAFPALGCQSGLPMVGSAKIMTQEIIKFLKKGQTTLKEIEFYLDNDEAFNKFRDTIVGYVSHIQTTLGDEPYTTVDIIIELDDGIILIERSNPPYGWALPGGFLDPDESLETAAAREAKEETNMDCEDLRQFKTYSEPGRDPRFHTISTVFIAKGKGIPQFGDDAKGLKIVKYDDLLNLEYAFDHKQIIKEYLESKSEMK